MSDAIKHECGLAFIRLLKPLDFYKKKYGTPLYGLISMQYLLNKQTNRGQDGTGIAVIKLDPNMGKKYIARKRNAKRNSTIQLFEDINKRLAEIPKKKRNDVATLIAKYPYAGQVLLGHLRYGTHGGAKVENCHPFIRQSNWMSRNLILAGNYNITNVNELVHTLVDIGQQPKEMSDNVTLLEKIGHFLDAENQYQYSKYKRLGFKGQILADKIKDSLNIEKILKSSFKNVDGGYHMVGMVGHGDAFALRDPAGLRPAFYYKDDEIVVVASERSAIQSVFNLKLNLIQEIKPGNALIIPKSGETKEVQIVKPTQKMSCSFERIYFGKGNDADIYKERKKLGYLLANKVLKHVNYDFENTVFSYVPNTAASAFYGLIDGVNDTLNDYKLRQIKKLNNGGTDKNIIDIIKQKPRREKILLKDVKMRTFISKDDEREGMVNLVYDVTYGILKPKQDKLVIMDDSIVRGTTLKTSILKILARLEPKEIVVVSSAPIILYPDCYGIDMSRLKDLVGFKALLSILKKDKKENLLEEVLEDCKLENEKPSNKIKNMVCRLFDGISQERLAEEIGELVKPKNFKPKLTIIYQSIENLKKASPDHKGLWYFNGIYPTAGGNKVANRAFIYFMEGNDKRAY